MGAIGGRASAFGASIAIARDIQSKVHLRICSEATDGAWEGTAATAQALRAGERELGVGG